VIIKQKEKKMKRILSISALLVVLGVFLAADMGYTIPPKGKTRASNETAQNRTSKKSVLEAIQTLQQRGKLVEEARFTLAEFEEWRTEDGRATSGDEGWGISITSLRRELDSLRMLGIFRFGDITEADVGGSQEFIINITVDGSQVQEMDQRFQKEIPSLTRADGQRPGQSIGLNSYDLTEVASTDEVMQMRQITGEVLCSNGRIETGPLKGMGYTQVVALTEGIVMDPDRSPLVRTKTANIGPNRRLVIATPHELETDSEGNLTPQTEEYIMSVLRNLRRVGIENAEDLFKQEIIVFSYIPEEDILAQIRYNATGTDGALNHLSPAQARTVVSRV